MFSLSLSMNKMEKEFVPYQQSLALKELGFNDEVLKVYDVNSSKSELYNYGEVLTGDDELYAPLYQQAFRWFREKYGLYFSIQYFQYDEWCLQITTKKEDTVFNYKSIDGFKTYEEAELAFLIKLIEIVKNK